MLEHIQAYVGYFMAGVVVLFQLWLLIRIFVRIYRDKYAPIKKVKAVITDKYVSDQFPRIYGSAARKAFYTVVFAVGEKKLSFRVSESTYPSYPVGKKGTLCYKGSKLIEFR